MCDSGRQRFPPKRFYFIFPVTRSPYYIYCCCLAFFWVIYSLVWDEPEIDKQVILIFFGSLFHDYLLEVYLTYFLPIYIATESYICTKFIELFPPLFILYNSDYNMNLVLVILDATLISSKFFPPFNLMFRTEAMSQFSFRVLKSCISLFSI